MTQGETVVKCSMQYNVRLKVTRRQKVCTWIPWNLSFRYILFHEKRKKTPNDAVTPESIHTKDESKRDSAFAFIFGVNWPVQWMQQNDKFNRIHDLCFTCKGKDVSIANTNNR